MAAVRLNKIGRASGLFCLALLLAGCTPPANEAPIEFVTSLNAERRYDEAQLKRGRVAYLKNCTGCHGAKGEGRTQPWNVRGANGFYPPPPLDDTAHAWHHSSKVLARTIREGAPPGQGQMPGWGQSMSEAEIADVVVYITSLWSSGIYRQWYEQVEAPARRGEIVR